MEGVGWAFKALRCPHLKLFCALSVAHVTRAEQQSTLPVTDLLSWVILGQCKYKLVAKKYRHFKKLCTAFAVTAIFDSAASFYIQHPGNKQMDYL